MKKVFTFMILSLLMVDNSLWAQEIVFPAQAGLYWGYIDTEGSWIIEPEYAEAREFTEGLAAVKSLNRWGYIDRYGNWLIKPQFENAIPFNEGVAAVIFDNRWGFIDHDGLFVVQPDFHKASSFSEGLALVSKGDGFFYITHKGFIVGNEKFKRALPFAEGLAPIVVDSEKGYIDNNGNLAIKHQYEIANPFSEGRAQVRQNGHWGFIDRNGNVVIPLEYASTGHFSDDLAAAVKKTKWGYIDSSGEWVIKPEYENAAPFHYGYASVTSKGKVGIIDKQSSWIVKPEFNAIGLGGRPIGLKDELTLKIQQAFSKWALKGEFEKTDDYIDRMNEESQALAMNRISTRIIKEYGDNKIDFENAELGYYDADLERFNLYLPGTLPTIIEVPIGQALWFKEQWRSGSFEFTEYLLAGESLIISNYVFNLNGQYYPYELTEEDGYLYSYASISWQEEIRVPEISWNIGSPEEVTKAIPGSSDVDSNIPIAKYLNENTFALIIGNEDYQSFQSGLNDEVDVSYAAIDAEIFSEYAKKTLGIPETNITLIQNGTAGQIKQALSKMSSIAAAYEGEAEFIFYYAGHGLPDEVTGKPYLIPVDVTGSDLSFAISLDEALNTLTEHEHRRVTVFLDACFTGGGRNEGLIASRGVKIKPKSPFVKGNLVLFAASNGNQSAFAYDEKAHGLFTYYLLKKLQETEGRVSFGELEMYLNDKVRKSAIIYNNNEQNPELLVSPSFKDIWKDFRLNVPYVSEETAGDFRK